MSNKMRVKRPFWLNGTMHLTDDVVAVDDPATINVLMQSGRAEPADEKTRGRLRTSSLITWSKARPNDGLGFRV